MQTWEYSVGKWLKKEKYSWNNQKYDRAVDMLNAAGAENWELVSTESWVDTATPSFAETTDVHYYFKRLKA